MSAASSKRDQRFITLRLEIGGYWRRKMIRRITHVRLFSPLGSERRIASDLRARAGGVVAVEHS
jgi:hypothetical protein